MTAHQTTRPSRRSALQVAAGVSLVLAGVLNGLPQQLTHLVTGDLGTFSDQIRWSVDHPAIHRGEQLALLVSSFFLPIGLLGLAWVAHHRARRLTAVAAVLAVWGMWGFHNVLAMGYTTGTVAPDAIGVDAAVRLNDGLVDDVGVLVTALLPHLVGSFFGLLLLAVACWRSGLLPKLPLLLMVGFLVWDFGLPPVGPLEPHLLLVLSWVWLGVAMLRLPREVWLGGDAPRAGQARTARSILTA